MLIQLTYIHILLTLFTEYSNHEISILKMVSGLKWEANLKVGGSYLKLIKSIKMIANDTNLHQIPLTSIGLPKTFNNEQNV